VKLRGSLCIFIQSMNSIVPAGLSTVICRAPNGWQGMVTSTCYVVARLIRGGQPVFSLFALRGTGLALSPHMSLTDPKRKSRLLGSHLKLECEDRWLSAPLPTEETRKPR
jgi:hypothetical protein